MRARLVAYWITTALFALAMTGSAYADLVPLPPIVEGFGHLGYPMYLATLLGVWKLLGVVALLAPRTQRLKEWAYAGFFFELTGAAYSHLAGAQPGVGAPLVLVGLLLASWWLRPASRVVGALTLGMPELPTSAAPRPA